MSHQGDRDPDDIAIVPSRRTRDPDDVDISWTLGPYRFELPLLSAALDGVVSPETAGLVGKLGAHQDRRQHRGRNESECQPAKPIHLEINPNAGHRRRASLVAATTARSPTPSQARLALALNCRLTLLARSSNRP